MAVLRSLAFYTAFYLGTVVYVLAGLACIAVGSPRLQNVVRGWSCWHRRCVTGILRIRVVVEGALPSAGVLVAAKHESFFEAIDMPCLLESPSVFAKAELLRLPLWGKVARDYGLVAVERDQGAKALRTMIAAARAKNEAGRLLVIFPEGTRVPHGTAPDLQSGFAGLYKLLGLPVVPIAVDSGPLYHRRWKRCGTITYRVGEAVPAGLAREEAEARVKAAINGLNG